MRLDYPVKQYDSEKAIVFATTNILGGKNYLLGGFYLGVGSLSFIFALVFIIAYCRGTKNKIE